MKPMLAGKVDLDKLSFPMIASPKLDGLRGLVQDGKLLSRSLKLIPNKHVQKVFGSAAYNGIDGELIFGPPNAPDVYRKSSSAIMGQEGTPFVTFWVFDRFDLLKMPYDVRRQQAKEVVDRHPVTVGANIRLLTQQTVHTLQELLDYEQYLLNDGYEGVILRNAYAPYKFGRSTMKEAALLKLKRFEDDEAIIIGAEEQMHNGNEATKNELGRTKRSTAKAGLTGKDTMGALVCLTKEQIEFKIGTGMDDDEKARLWKMYLDGTLVGQYTKYKSFRIGVKDAPRHPVYLGLRDARDMS